MTKGILGILLALASLWGGAYAMSFLPYTHWASFPAFFTACFSFLAGIALAIIGFVK